MAEKAKGEKVALIRHTFGRNNNSDLTTAHYVSAGDVEGVKRNTEYFVEFENSGRTNIDVSDIDPFVVKVHSSKEAFSVPRDIIREHDILPGHSVIIKLYEIEERETEPTELVDDSNVIGRARVMSDKTSADGCQARLMDSTTYDYIGDDEMSLTFRNLKNNKQATGSSITQNESDRSYSFPVQVRSAIDAKPGDLIETMPTKDNDKGELDTEEKVDEIYEMVSELYEAYTAAKND